MKETFMKLFIIIVVGLLTSLNSPQHVLASNTAEKKTQSHFFRTLAAAYARSGQFDQAITAQKKAIELLAEDKVFSEEIKQQLRVDNKKKLELYKNHQAYIDEH